MLNLIRLEFKKFNLINNVKGVILADCILLGILIMLSILTRIDGEILFESATEQIIFIDLLVRDIFIIFSSVILAKLTVGEYKNRTMQLMFMYPINRKKILIAKLLIVYMFAVLAILSGDIFLIGGIKLIDNFIDVVPNTLTLQAIIEQVPMLCVSMIMSGFLAIMPLYFGMKKKSTSHTIIASVVIVALMSSSFGGSITDSYYLVRCIALGGIAIISIVITMGNALNNIDSIDIE